MEGRLRVGSFNVQAIKKSQHHPDCHAELVSVSDGFNALGDPETSSG